jgi:hypothetical protein
LRESDVPSLKSVLPVLAAMAFATPALAQPARTMPVLVEDGHLAIEAQDQRFVIPMPDWIDPSAADWTALASPRFTDIGSEAHLEIYKPGEGAAFWTSQYGARITRLDNPVLAEFRAVVMDAYARTCRPNALAFFQLEADDGDSLPPLGFVCGAYRDPAAADEGEITIMSFFKSDTGVAMLYQGWRGTAFDIANAATWPVSAGDIESHVASLADEPVLSAAD